MSWPPWLALAPAPRPSRPRCPPPGSTRFRSCVWAGTAAPVREPVSPPEPSTRRWPPAAPARTCTRTAPEERRRQSCRSLQPKHHRPSLHRRSGGPLPWPHPGRWRSVGPAPSRTRGWPPFRALRHCRRRPCESRPRGIGRTGSWRGHSGARPGDGRARRPGPGSASGTGGTVTHTGSRRIEPGAACRSSPPPGRSWSGGCAGYAAPSPWTTWGPGFPRSPDLPGARGPPPVAYGPRARPD
mmetsp:Transcript_4843/g.13565  ORF Transcript_4843/g.13565 Transcript_4843/m.13565 type:complete len:241 (+) Transcript_4843:2682-3404(+)